MKLLHVAVWRLSLVMAVVLSVWAFSFYAAMMEEVDDETDDALEDFAELVIIRSLRGEYVPTAPTGSNNQYFQREVSPEYAAAHNTIDYEDREVFIKEKGETEPARVLTYIYRTDDGKYMELEVSAPHIDKEDLRRAIFYWSVFLYAALLVVLVVLNVWIFRRNIRPLYVLLDWLKRYRLGARNEPLVNPTRISEFRQLNEAARRYSERSEQIYEQQKQFIGNASHEMQTPLAVCLNRLDLLVDDEALSERQLGEILKVRRTLDNLTRLNRSLLLLCKIDNGQFPESTRVSFNALFNHYLPDYQTAYAYLHIGVRLHESGVFETDMNESLAATLLTNLLKNAYVHNVRGGEIEINVTPASVRIANTSDEGALDPSLIFMRFHHSRRKEGSTGLGLSLVRAICRQYSLTVTYAYEDGRHVFEVKR